MTAEATTPTWDSKASLAQRLVRARIWLADHPLVKEGERKPSAEGGGGQYKFLAWDDVADAVGGALARHGVDVQTSLEELFTEEARTPSGKETTRWMAQVLIELTNADDVADRQTSHWRGGCDDKETATGISKATTYALKDFLLKRFVLSGDDSDQRQIPDAATGAAASDQLACPLCGRGHLVQRTMGADTWVSCTNWRPKKAGCNFRFNGTLAAYVAKEQQKEAASAPTGEFVDRGDGPVELTQGELPGIAAPPPPEPAPLGEYAQRIVDWVADQTHDRKATRDAIARAGGVATLVLAEDGSVKSLRGSVLRSLDDKVLKKILAELEATLTTSAPE